MLVSVYVETNNVSRYIFVKFHEDPDAFWANKFPSEFQARKFGALQLFTVTCSRSRNWCRIYSRAICFAH